MPGVRLLEWGDRIVATDPNTVNNKFCSYFNLSSRRDMLAAQVATLSAELSATLNGG
jgi:hypothetical protein